MQGFISAEQLRDNIINYAHELIHIQQLEYLEYEARIKMHIAAVETKNAYTEVNKTLKEAFLEVLNHILPEKFYNDAKGDVNESDSAGNREESNGPCSAYDQDGESGVRAVQAENPASN